MLLYEIIKKQNIDLVIIGPEQPLVDGLVDYLNKKKLEYLVQINLLHN